LAKEELIVMDGVVEEVLPNAMFKVRVTEAHTIIAMISGKMRMNKIRILMGDKVKVEMSAYDLNKGRVIFRDK
jgi:translation initiation factor IF-1